MDAADVPHFMDGTSGKGEAPKALDDAEAWLNERGLTQINILFPGETPLDQLLVTVKNCNTHSPGIVFMLGGESRTGVNHVVLCCDGEIVCDPSQTDSGIIGPCDDGYYWVTFFGAVRTSVRHASADHAEADFIARRGERLTGDGAGTQRITIMSMVICDDCERPIDSDFDADCFIENPHASRDTATICENCREPAAMEICECCGKLVSVTFYVKGPVQGKLVCVECKPRGKR